MGLICGFVQIKTLAKGCYYDRFRGVRGRLGVCGDGPLICVGQIHWLGSNFEGMTLCNRKESWAACHEHAAKEAVLGQSSQKVSVASAIYG